MPQEKHWSFYVFFHKKTSPFFEKVKNEANADVFNGVFRRLDENPYAFFSE